MNKFWEWMDEKGYCVNKYIIDRIWINSTDYIEVKFTNQTLVGPMLEYLAYKNITFTTIVDGKFSITDYYNQLVEIINERV